MYKFVFVLLMDMVFGALGFFWANHGKRVLEATESTIGLMQVVSSVCYIVGCTILIRLASRRHAALALVVSAAGITGILAVQLAWISVPSFFVLGGLIGLVAAFFFIHFQILIRDESDGRDLRRKVGYYNLAWGIGYALGPGLSGLLYEWSAYGPLVLVTIVAGAVTVLSALYRPRPAPPAADLPTAPPPPQSVAPEDHRYVWLGWTGVFVAILTTASMRQMFPPAATDLGMASWQAGAVLFVAVVTSALTSGALIFLRDYVYRLRWKLCFHALGLVGWLAFAMTTHFGLFLVAAVPIGVWSGSCLYASFFYSMNHPETTRTVSANELIVGVGLAIGPGLGGVLAEQDLHWPYWFNMALVAALMVVQVFLRFTVLRRRPAEAGRVG